MRRVARKQGFSAAGQAKTRRLQSPRTAPARLPRSRLGIGGRRSGGRLPGQHLAHRRSGRFTPSGGLIGRNPRAGPGAALAAPRVIWKDRPPNRPRGRTTGGKPIMSAHSQSLILHQYDMSPFSEKIRDHVRHEGAGLECLRPAADHAQTGSGGPNRRVSPNPGAGRSAPICISIPC